MSITQHPKYPFIEIGTSLDFAKRGGYHKHPDFFGADDEWEYKIDGSSGGVLCQSQDDAIESAEEHLFLFDADVVEKKIAEYLKTDLSLALRLVEDKGYWRGKRAENERIKTLLAPAVEQIELATR